MRNKILFLGIIPLLLLVVCLPGQPALASSVLFSDNFTSNSGWTQVGTAVGISGGHVVINGPDGTDHHIYKSLGGNLDSKMPFKLDFDFKYSASVNPAHILVALTNDTINPGFAGNQLGVGVGNDGNDLAITYTHLPDLILQFSNSTIPVSLDTVYYVTMERLNSTFVKLSAFSDPTRTTPVAGSPVYQQIPSTITGFTTVESGTAQQGCICRFLTAFVDDTVISLDPIGLDYMQDNTTSTGLSTFNGRQIQAEFVTSASQLVGHKINSITLDLRKTGLPTGTAQIGVFNTDLSVKKLFGTLDPSTLTGVYNEFTVALPISDTPYTIESGDRIGIKYTGGNSTNFVAVMRDTNPTDPFDGSNSYHTYFDTAWRTFTSNDLYMTLKLNVIPPTVTASPPSGTYTGSQFVTLQGPPSSTICYTTDGSEPTWFTCHPGPSQSPIVGIKVDTNSTLKFWAIDSLGVIGPTIYAQYTILLPVITQMSDTVATFGLNTNSIVNIQSEYLSSTSSLVGKPIDTITVDLKKTGSPTGIVQVGILNSDKSVKQLFGTIDTSSITPYFAQYTFSLASPQSYMLQSGDRIGIKFTGGNSTNSVTIMTDQTNAFDGSNTYLTNYDTFWHYLPGKDLFMILKWHQSS